MSQDPCGWCGKPSVTEVITVAGRKNKRTAPVCEEHARVFESQGQMTTRLELDLKMSREKKRAEYWKGVKEWR